MAVQAGAATIIMRVSAAACPPPPRHSTSLLPTLLPSPLNLPFTLTSPISLSNSFFSYSSLPLSSSPAPYFLLAPLLYPPIVCLTYASSPLPLHLPLLSPTSSSFSPPPSHTSPPASLFSLSSVYPHLSPFGSSSSTSYIFPHFHFLQLPPAIHTGARDWTMALLCVRLALEYSSLYRWEVKGRSVLQGDGGRHGTLVQVLSPSHELAHTF